MSSPPFETSVPDVLADLNAVAAAVLTKGGGIEDANAGFRRLVDAYAGSDGDVRALFRQPPFDELLGSGEAWEQTHDGIVNLGDPDGEETVSLEGVVHSREDQIVLLAEYDLESEAKLRERVLGLNEELAEAQREMRRELRAREEAEARLERKASDLERSNDLLQEFAYVVSHDLQEPLRMVESYLGLLEKRYSDELDEDAHEFIDYAVDGAQRMREMIQGLLEYSQVQSQASEPEPTELAAAVDDALENLQVRIEETQAEIEVDALGIVLADRGQLVHLFQNLVDNAIKYSEQTPRVHVGAEPGEDGMVRVFVADQGAGIPENEQETLFEIFQRGADAKGEGTGVGLAVCKRIVERHGGRMWVESALGEGSTFWFTLPPAGEADDQASDPGP